MVMIDETSLGVSRNRFVRALLGDERDVDDVIAAARKIAQHAAELRAAKLERAPQ